jgi:hypothetical protein
MDKEITYGRNADLLRSVAKIGAKRLSALVALAVVALTWDLIVAPTYTIAKVGDPPAASKKALTGPIPMTSHKYAPSPGPECGIAKFIIEIKGNWVKVESASGSLPKELEPNGRIVSSDRGIEMILGSHPCRLNIVISGAAREAPRNEEQPRRE